MLNSTKDENGMVKKFYPDGMATLVPNGTLGNTWFGMTPEERTLLSKPGRRRYSC